MPASTAVSENLRSSPRSGHGRQPGESEAMIGRLNSLSKKPLAFWFLNQWLEEAELSRQILELKEKGFGGFFMHPRGGLEVPYGSRRWYEVIGYCVREAKRLGLEAWLYDEDPYPSGAAGGRVTLENPAFKAMELRSHRVEIRQTGEVCVDFPEGMLHAAYLIDEDGVHQIDEEAGIVRTEWNQKMRLNSYYPPYGDQGTPHWRAETHSPHFRIATFVRKVPATLIGFIRNTVAQNPWGDFPDLMNGGAVDAFLRLTHQRYFERVGSEIGETVPGIFTDESKLRGVMPWTPRLDRWLQEVGKVELREVLPHLVVDLDESTPWFRWVYREALARAFLSQFVDRVREACREYGLLWTGHFSPEEDPIAQVIYVPGLFRVLRRMEIPGTDLIGSNLGNSQRPLLHLSPKIASSVAHLSGVPYVSCEALAVTDWVQDFEFITRAIHWLFALGVNRIVTHGQYYSIDGLRKREAPPSQFYQASGWEHMPALMGQIERLSELLSQGKPCASVLLYYPEETFMALTRESEPGRSTSCLVATEQREKLGALVHKMLVRGYDFDFTDEENLLNLALSDKKELFLRNQCREPYQIILVPGIYFTEQAWEHLSRLREQGATVRFLEPEVTVLRQTPFQVRVGAKSAEGALFDEIRARASPLWEAEGELIGHLRETPDGHLLFLCNISDTLFKGRVKLIFPGPYEVCDPATGSWEFAGAELRLELPRGLGVLIRSSQAKYLPPHVVTSGWKPMPALWEHWTATPLAENALFLHEFSFITKPRRSSEQWTELMRGGVNPDLPEASEFHNGRLVDLASPGGADGVVKDGGDRYLMTAFDWSGPLSDVRLVCDSDLLPSLSKGIASRKLFFLNGTPLSSLTRRRTFDPMNLEAPLSGLIREGRNMLIWVQEGNGKENHLPYDGIRFFGDFQVEFPFAHSSLVNLSKRRITYLCGAPMPPQMFGHAHYHGIVEYGCHVTLPRLPDRIALRFGRVYESIEVIINGRSAGYLWKEPYLLEIPPDLLQPGRNEVALRCATSPANYLQGLQRPAGCLGPIEWCTCS